MFYQVPWAKEFLATVIFSIAYHGGGMPQMVNGQTKMDLNEDPSVWYHCNGWFLWPSGRYYISQILIIWEHMMIQVFSYHQSCALPLSPIFFTPFALLSCSESLLTFSIFVNLSIPFVSTLTAWWFVGIFFSLDQWSKCCANILLQLQIDIQTSQKA